MSTPIDDSASGDPADRPAERMLMLADGVPVLTPAVARALEQAQEFVEHSLADGTNDVYARAWALFRTWCHAQALEPLPCAPAVLAAFLAHHANPHERPAWENDAPVTVQSGGLSPSRLEVFRSAVRKEHQMAGYADPGADPLIGKLMRGIRRSWTDRGKSKKQVEALTASSLGTDDAPTLRLVLDAIDTATVRGIRDRALVLVGFAGALRRSEICKLAWGDVTTKAGGLNLLLRGSKTDKDSRGHTVGIPRIQNTTSKPGAKKALCPVASLEAWRKALSEAGHSTGGLNPVFRDVNRWGSIASTPLHPGTVARIIKRLVAAVPQEGLDEDLRARLDPARYAGHSLRAGFVTTAAIDGQDLLDILMTTRHAEPRTVLDYVRAERLAGRNAVRDALAGNADQAPDDQSG